jgi:hypothetical protein
MTDMNGSKWDYYDLHGLVRMRVDRSAGTANFLADIFRGFKVPSIEDPNLDIEGKVDPLENVSSAEGMYEFNRTGVFFGEMGVQVLFEDDRITVQGKRELLTTVLPLVDWQMLRQGAAMIHAATFVHRGIGIAMPAWGGVGKTSAIAKLAKDPAVEFMGDDWAFVDDAGTMLAFPKPMFIKPHHRPIYPHLFEKKRKPLIPSRISKPVGRLTTLVHPFITKVPRLAALLRRWSPEHMMVRPQDALPDARMSVRAPLGAAVFTERFQGKDLILEERSADWMVSRIIGNFHAEMSAHSRDVLTGLAATGHVPAETFFGEKARILGTSLAGIPCYELRVPEGWSADRASDAIVEVLLTIDRRGED